MPGSLSYLKHWRHKHKKTEQLTNKKVQLWISKLSLVLINSHDIMELETRRTFKGHSFVISQSVLMIFIHLVAIFEKKLVTCIKDQGVYSMWNYKKLQQKGHVWLTLAPQICVLFTHHLRNAFMFLFLFVAVTQNPCLGMLRLVCWCERHKKACQKNLLLLAKKSFSNWWLIENAACFQLLQSLQSMMNTELS